MENVEKARELYRALEEGRIRSATETALRAFKIQQRLSELRG
jgi:hypothetical protein